MNILFLNPPFKGRFSRTSRSPAVTKGGTLYYPFWLAYAAGVAEKAGHEVRLLDAPADGYLKEDIPEKLAGFVPKLIVLDTSTPSIYNDVRVGIWLKQRYPHSFLTLVGTHPSALPHETLQIDESIDAIACEEYDYTIRDLAKTLEDGQTLDSVKGLVFRDKGTIRQNQPREKIENLDELPFVSEVYKKHLKYRNYFFAAANYPMMMIITGRGCPFSCFFCVYPQTFHNRKYRYRSPKNVVDEFEYIINNFPEVKEIGIEDDCFTANPKRVREISQLIIDRRLKIKWYCNARGDVDYETLKLMRKAGCRLITVGFESANQLILDNIHKGEKVQRYYQFAKDAKKAGILVHGCIMIGNPGDNKEIMKKNYEFACRINCDSMQFYPLYVYPGTEAYEWAQENKLLKTTDFSCWLDQDGLHNCVLDLPDLTAEEMVQLCDFYLKKYHLRPKYVLMKIFQAIINPSEGYRSFKSFVTFLKHILRGQI